MRDEPRRPSAGGWFRDADGEARAIAPGAAAPSASAVDVAPSLFDPVVARGEHVAPGTARELSKKEEWLREKELRPDYHTTDADLARAQTLMAKAEKAAKHPQAARGKRDAADAPASMAPGAKASTVNRASTAKL